MTQSKLEISTSAILTIQGTTITVPELQKFLSRVPNDATIEFDLDIDLAGLGSPESVQIIATSTVKEK